MAVSRYSRCPRRWPEHIVEVVMIVPAREPIVSRPGIDGDRRMGAVL
jgi:hypothetical protein